MITIGTDCSGIEAPIEALKQMKIPYKHLWSCEKDKYAIQSLLANNHPEKLYYDITKRQHGRLPDVDIYVCGFPCQPFSLMGHKQGTNDDRGNIMLECIKVIQKKRPKVFILENVKNFKYIEESKPYNYLINTLKSIKTINKDNEYNIYDEILNTKDYGIPQNRERVYIIGIRKDIQKKEFIKPSKIQMKELDDFIIDQSLNTTFKVPKTIMNKLVNLKDVHGAYVKNYVCACDSFSIMKNMTPTITASNCKSMYNTTYNRYLTPQECLLLQGFSEKFKQVVSNTQLCKQIGNSMSVNVLIFLFDVIFKITTL